MAHRLEKEGSWRFLGQKFDLQTPFFTQAIFHLDRNLQNMPNIQRLDDRSYFYFLYPANEKSFFAKDHLPYLGFSVIGHAPQGLISPPYFVEDFDFCQVYRFKHEFSLDQFTLSSLATFEEKWRNSLASEGIEVADPWKMAVAVSPKNAIVCVEITFFPETRD